MISTLAVIRGGSGNLNYDMVLSINFRTLKKKGIYKPYWRHHSIQIQLVYL